MTIDLFPQFLKAVHGIERPFRWQERLLREIVDRGAWPEGGIRLPTAAGKTTVLDIAVFLLALQADQPLGKRVGRLRTFLVIDRRLVVDQGLTHAQRMASALATGTDPVVMQVADRLRSFGSMFPLLATALRGGMYHDHAWVSEPNQPLVCVTTVDQIGSRLLFRGYGVSEEQRPVHAGLAGTDSLLILDEAHLSKPFDETVQAIRVYQNWTNAFPALDFVRMSATIEAGQAFELIAEDTKDDGLLRRLGAKKIAELREGNLVTSAVEAARELMVEDRVKVVGVVVNTVSRARKIFEHLRSDGTDAILLTGRIRPYDRDRMLTAYLDRIQAKRERKDTDAPLYVVATQTVEVGADLDFDALVTEVAPLDALRQRFGRLDRLGELGECRAVILRDKSLPDLIYDGASERCWQWLSQKAVKKKKSKTEKAGRRIDFGVDAIDKLVGSEDLAAINSPKPSAPVMLPGHVESWVQTNPSPGNDPDVAPFLHGPDAANAADVLLVWRADLEGKTWKKGLELLEFAPPMMMEALPLPVGTARAWLRRQARDVSDIEGVETAEDGEPSSGDYRSFWVWRGPDKSLKGLPRAGDTVVLPSSAGGCDEFGWNPDSQEQVKDIGEECSLALAGALVRPCRVRLDGQVLFQTSTAEEGEARRTFRSQLERAFPDDGEYSESEIRQGLLSYCEEFFREHQPLRELPLHFALPYLRNATVERTPGGWLLEEPWSEFRTRREQEKKNIPRLALHEFGQTLTDEAEASQFTSRMTLERHQAGVIAWVRAISGRCGVPARLVDDLCVAAEHHDIGKGDVRFQGMLRDGSLEAALAASELLAKSKSPRSRWKAHRDAAGYPANGRHEFVSAGVVEKLGLATKAQDQDLVFHLIGSHHGYGRALPAAWTDGEGGAVRIQQNGSMIEVGSEVGLYSLGSGWTERFWRLHDRYGAWGLAYLEALLRRADCLRSAEENA